MSAFDSRSDPTRQSPADSRPANAPASCPACHSVAVTSTAKSPDVNSYWRCDRCGEVWNVSRRHRSNRGAWR